MGRRAETGPTHETESGEETLRVAAVETAWRLLRMHPNWFRCYGFSVGEAGMAEFAESLQRIKAVVRSRVERLREREFGGEHGPDLPDTADAMLTAVYLLRMGRRPVRPIPSGIGPTWRALLPFCAMEVAAGQPAAAACSSGVLDGEGWTVDPVLVGRPRAVH